MFLPWPCVRLVCFLVSLPPRTLYLFFFFVRLLAIPSSLRFSLVACFRWVLLWLLAAVVFCVFLVCLRPWSLRGALVLRMFLCLLAVVVSVLAKRPIESSGGLCRSPYFPLGHVVYNFYLVASGGTSFVSSASGGLRFTWFPHVWSHDVSVD